MCTQSNLPSLSSISRLVKSKIKQKAENADNQTKNAVSFSISKILSDDFDKPRHKFSPYSAYPLAYYYDRNHSKDMYTQGMYDDNDVADDDDSDKDDGDDDVLMIIAVMMTMAMILLMMKMMLMKVLMKMTMIMMVKMIYVKRSHTGLNADDSSS